MKGKEADKCYMSDEKFKSIINEYEKLIFTVCYQFVRDYQEAQNLTQETFLSAYKCIDKIGRAHV